MAAALIALRREIAGLKKEVNRLKRLALSDQLTGLGNRRAFKESMTQHISEYKRAVHGGDKSEIQTKSFTLVVLDINDLKHVNDTAGHTAGDKMISIVAEAIKKTVRRFESAYRLGGDELAIILTDTPNVVRFADRLESNIGILAREAEFLHKLTVAIGFASVTELPAEKHVLSSDAEIVSVLSDLADGRMYKHKQEMKNAMYLARR